MLTVYGVRRNIRGMKTCKQCGESKPVEDGFYRSKRYGDGLDTYCKDCRNGRHAAWVVANRKPPKPKPTEKACSGCGLVQPVTAFYSSGPNKRGSLCRKCNTERHREWVKRPEVAARLLEMQRRRAEGKRKRPPRREPIAPGFEVCTMCNEDKPLDAFHAHKLGRNGKDSACKECKSQYSRVRNARPDVKEKERDYRNKRRFGISAQDYDERLESQGGGCAICGNPPSEGGKRLHVDHDHGTGAVRGLLCYACNAAIGLMCDDTERLAAAIRYLNKES